MNIRRRSAISKINLMKQTRRQGNNVLWAQTFGFTLIIVLSWLTEALRIPHYLFNEPFTPNWHRAILRTIVLATIWACVHVSTRQLLKRLHYLEEFLRVCGWCRRVCHEGEWLEMEKYFKSKFDARTTHGMCPDCLKKHVREIMEKKQQQPVVES